MKEQIHWSEKVAVAMLWLIAATLVYMVVKKTGLLG
jgi:hypothetical protein